MTGSQKHRNLLPYVFTEHEVAMLASILKSEKAIAMNIAIVTTFISLRKMPTEANELAESVRKIRETVSDHEDQLKKILAAIRMLLLDKAKQKKWEDRGQIGFYQKENKYP